MRNNDREPDHDLEDLGDDVILIATAGIVVLFAMLGVASIIFPCVCQ